VAEGVAFTDDELRHLAAHCGWHPGRELAQALLDERAKIRDAIAVLTDPRTAAAREGDRIVASMLGIPESTLKTNG